MTIETVIWRDWEFEVDKVTTENTYTQVSEGGAESCACNDCKNYVAFRDHVFPKEVSKMFITLGIDFRKDVEVVSYETLTNGLHHIGGWFHFKGQVLKGKDCCIPLPNGGFTFDWTEITDNFSIGFFKGSAMTYFEDKTGLVQIEFDTYIPWVIDEALETSVD